MFADGGVTLTAARRPFPSARIAVWATLAAAAVFILTVGGTYPGVASVEMHLIGQLIAYLVLGGWSLIAFRDSQWRPETALLRPLVVAVLAYAVSAAFSQRFRLGLEPTLAGIGWALGLVFIATLLRDNWFRQRVAVLLISSTVLVASAYIVQVLWEWFVWWQALGFVSIPPLRPSFVGLLFGSPNLVATYLLLTCPLSIALLMTTTSRKRPSAVVAILVALAVILTGSRGAYLGVVVGFIATAVLASSAGGWTRAIHRAREALQDPRVRVLLIGAAAAIAVLGPAILLRLAAPGGTVRLDLWQSAVEIFRSHPILGGGPGTWVQLKIAANAPEVRNWILPHAHSLYLQSAAEIGTLGIVALTLLAAAVLRTIRNAVHSVSTRIHALAVTFALSSFAGQSLVDNLTNLPFVILLIATNVGWIVAYETKPRPVPSGTDMGAMRNVPSGQTRALGMMVPVLALAGLCILSPTLLSIDRAASEFQVGNAAALRGDWQAAQAHYAEAHRIDPDFTLYEIQYAVALANRGRIHDARVVLERATSKDQIAVHQIGLAVLATQEGDLSDALNFARRAAATGYEESAIALNAGVIGEIAGDLRFALEQFSNAIAWNPALARSPFWHEASRRVPFDAVLDAARQKAKSHDAALVLAYAGRQTRARIELEGLPPTDTRVVYEAAIAWLGGDPKGALQMLESRLRANPKNWFAAAWAARIARLSGDDRAFQRYRQLAVTVQADSALATVFEPSVIKRRGAPDEGLQGNYPWAVYLRPASPYLLIPGVLIVGFQ